MQTLSVFGVLRCTLFRWLPPALRCGADFWLDGGRHDGGLGSRRRLRAEVDEGRVCGGVLLQWNLILHVIIKTAHIHTHLLCRSCCGVCYLLNIWCLCFVQSVKPKRSEQQSVLNKTNNKFWKALTFISKYTSAPQTTPIHISIAHWLSLALLQAL